MRPDRIALETPLERGWEPVFRLVLGGVADRLDLGFEDLDDIQLAVERLLAEAGTQQSVNLSFEILPEGLRTRIGPLREHASAEALEDIEQVGAIGLLKAIDRYDLEREVSLTTYATPNVVGEIKRHFRDKGWAIRVPRGLQELNAKMSGTIERLTTKFERSPTIAEIAAELEATPEQVLEAMEAGSAYSTISLSSGPGAGGGEDDDFDPMESIGAEDEEYERTEQRASLEPALETLPEREREILRMRFEEGLTQAQIAEKIGISQMHVSQLIRQSLSRMRDQLA